MMVQVDETIPGGGPMLDAAGMPVLDPTGAGDATVGALAAELARGLDVREAAKIMWSKQTAPNPKKLSPCPKCGDFFGVAEMRTHKPKCQGKST